MLHRSGRAVSSGRAQTVQGIMTVQQHVQLACVVWAMTVLSITISVIYLGHLMLCGLLSAPGVSIAGSRVPLGYCTNTAGRVQQYRVRWDLGDSQQAVAQ